MYYPYGIFVDAKDNVYYTDNENALVRKIDKESTVTTLAGTPGKSGYFGDGGLALKARIFNPGGLAINSTGDLFVADYGNNAVRKITYTK
jgi:DNA-binding beta-propeller fold protein YncE